MSVLPLLLLNLMIALFVVNVVALARSQMRRQRVTFNFRLRYE